MSDLSDAPLSDANPFDALGCTQLAAQVVARFHEGSEPPPNIAIYGPWGSGKSSLLYLLKKEFDRRSGAEAPLWIEIDAWAYQNEDTLIYAVLKALYAEAKQTPTESLLRIALGAALSLSDLALKLASHKNLSLKDIAENLDRAEGVKPFESKHLLLRDEFARIIDKLTKAPKAGAPRHILIAIDNLDRCKPDAAIRVLETLFLVGNTTHCTFVITVDQLVLISFLNRVYQGTQFNGARYLEKIFPVAFRIPDPWVYWSYGQALVYHEAGKTRDQVYVILDKLLSGTAWDDREEAAKEEIEEESIFATIWHFLAQPRILRNPRRIKRIARIVRSYKPETQDHAEQILFLVILADLWPEAFEFFLSTDDDTWQKWIDHLALASQPSPQGTIAEDQALRDFVYQIFVFYDPKGKSITKFEACTIRKQEILLNCLEDVRTLGL